MCHCRLLVIARHVATPTNKKTTPLNLRINLEKYKHPRQVKNYVPQNKSRKIRASTRRVKNYVPQEIIQLAAKVRPVRFLKVYITYISTYIHACPYIYHIMAIMYVSCLDVLTCVCVYMYSISIRKPPGDVTRENAT